MHNNKRKHAITFDAATSIRSISFAAQTNDECCKDGTFTATILTNQ